MSTTVMETQLPKFQKTLKAEFEGDKLVVASVDGEELVAGKIKRNLVNSSITQPTIEISEGQACQITIRDSQATWSFQYPRGVVL
jgi:hypothetical protein